jgi:uncharacterized membrane protein
MSMTPLIAIHTTAAVAAVVMGPLAFWARKGRVQRPRLHRAFGYAFVTLMVMAALSAIFISGERYPHIYGIGPVHILIPFVLVKLFLAFKYLAQKDIQAHQRTMKTLYIGACLIAGSFTLMPYRFLGNLLWHQWLGIV